MKYMCKNCGNVDYAKNLEDILGYGKLCGECLSEENHKNLVRFTSKEKKRAKGKNSK